MFPELDRTLIEEPFTTHTSVPSHSAAPAVSLVETCDCKSIDAVWPSCSNCHEVTCAPAGPPTTRCAARSSGNAGAPYRPRLTGEAATTRCVLPINRAVPVESGRLPTRMPTSTASKRRSDTIDERPPPSRYETAPACEHKPSAATSQRAPLCGSSRRGIRWKVLHRRSYGWSEGNEYCMTRLIRPTR